MSHKYALFCSKGLGDGLIFMLIANNIKNSGVNIVLYHDLLVDLNSWFPGINIKKYSDIKNIEEELSSYSSVIINTDLSKINIEIQKRSLELIPKSTYLLHATTCKGKKLPGNYYLDSKKTLVSNLFDFCKSELKLKNVKK